MITTESATALDGKRIVFGKVADEESKETVKRIMRYAAESEFVVFIKRFGTEEEDPKK